MKLQNFEPPHKSIIEMEYENRSKYFDAYDYVKKDTRTKSMKINQKIKNRVLNVANYIIESRVTIREAAKEFRVSKSTVHTDLTERLPIINPELYEEVRVLLNYHVAVRHLRGGEATKMSLAGISRHKKKKGVTSNEEPS